jgi:hypothetical protein
MKTELSNIQKQKINSWKNNIKTINLHDENLNWIVDNHKLIYDFIKSNYSNKNTVKSHILVLSQILKKKNKELSSAEKYRKENVKLSKQVLSDAENQTMTEKREQNFVCYEDIVKARENFKQLFMKNPNDNKLNLTWVLLSLYTLIPPIRKEYDDMKISENVLESNINYLLINKDGMYIIIQDDKVSDSHEALITKLPNNLQSVIEKSLHHFPRDYILSKINNGKEPIKANGFDRLLHDAFPNKNPGVDVLRSAYITHFYDKKISLRVKKELAKQMRHSVSTAEMMYKKVDIVCPQNIETFKIKEKFDIKKWNDDYYKNNKDKIKKKRMEKYENDKEKILRQKILRNLNKGSVKKPSANSIKLYDLKFDEEKKIWI